MKPVVVVSRCLGFAACRYDGARLDDPFVRRLAPFVVFRQVCPEEAIGLGTPRPPVRLVARARSVRLVQPETGADVTEAMRRYAEEVAASVGPVDGFLLKNRSPSCAPRDAKLYDEGGGPSRGRTAGLFAAVVTKAFPHAAVEDEGRLSNRRIREHFLTRLFAAARFRAARRRRALRHLVALHAAHKLLLMAHSERRLRRLGRLVANHEGLGVDELWRRYETDFLEALARPSRSSSNVNVLMHALGYFSKRLGPREKAHFLDLLEGYRAGRHPLSAPVAVVRSWIARFDEPYLAGQVTFAPYPVELASLDDSGKGRDED